MHTARVVGGTIAAFAVGAGAVAAWKLYQHHQRPIWVDDDGRFHVSGKQHLEVTTGPASSRLVPPGPLVAFETPEHDGGSSYFELWASEGLRMRNRVAAPEGAVLKVRGSFEDAVEVAAARARTGTRRWQPPIPQAVLQGRDGAYLVTELSYEDGSIDWSTKPSPLRTRTYAAEGVLALVDDRGGYLFRSTKRPGTYMTHRGLVLASPQ